MAYWLMMMLTNIGARCLRSSSISCEIVECSRKDAVLSLSKLMLNTKCMPKCSGKLNTKAFSLVTQMIV
jgi:hypothetical protein